MAIVGIVTAVTGTITEKSLYRVSSGSQLMVYSSDSAKTDSAGEAIKIVASKTGGVTAQLPLRSSSVAPVVSVSTLQAVSQKNTITEEISQIDVAMSGLVLPEQEINDEQNIVVQQVAIHAQPGGEFPARDDVIDHCGINIDDAGVHTLEDNLDCTGDDFWVDQNELPAIAISADNVIIDCQGHTIKGLFRETVPWLRHSAIFTRYSGVVIRNCNIDGFSEGVLHLPWPRADPATNIELSHNKILNSHDAMYFENVEGLTLVENSIIGGAFGIDIFSSTDVTIDTNIISANRNGGIFIDTSEEITIIDNHFLNNAYAVFAVRSDELSIRDNIISKNTFGILLRESSHNSVRWNTLDTEITGIEVRGDDTTISDNTVLNANFAILVRDGSDNDLTSNTLRNGGVGIYLRNTNQNELEQNVITNMRIIGLSINEVRDSSFEENLFIANRYGIDMSDSENNVIQDNSVRRGEYGLWLSNSQSNTIDDNTFAQNTITGLLLDAQSGANTLRNNIIDSNSGQDRFQQPTGYGLVFESSDNTFVRNRICHNRVSDIVCGNNDNSFDATKFGTITRNNCALEIGMLACDPVLI